MNHVPAGHVPMTHLRTANCVLLIMIVIGLGEGDFVPSSAFVEMHVMVGLTVSYLCFLWYRNDSDARGFLRPRLLSVAVAALPLAAIPYYLLRSRAADERGPALMAYLGFLLLTPVARWAGVAAHIALVHATT